MKNLTKIKKEITPELADELKVFFANTNLDDKEKNYLVELILRVNEMKKADFVTSSR